LLGTEVADVAVVPGKGSRTTPCSLCVSRLLTLGLVRP